MQVGREAVAGATVDPVIAVVDVVDRGEGRVDVTVGRVIGPAAHGAGGLEAIEVAERERPGPDIEFLEVLNRRQNLAWILLQ